MVRLNSVIIYSSFVTNQTVLVTIDH